MNYAIRLRYKKMEQPRMNLSIDQTMPVECEKCGHIYFEEALHIRKASGILTGTGQTTINPTGGVTVNGTPGLKLRAQWSSCTLVKRATDTWVAMGDLSA